MRDVAIEVGNQLTRKNDRNNKKEDTSKALGAAIIGLIMESEESRINNQKLRENQGIMEQKWKKKKERESMKQCRKTLSQYKHRRADEKGGREWTGKCVPKF